MKDQLPKDWRWVKLGEACEIRYGKGLPTKNLKPEGYPVFGANGIIGFNDKYLYQNPQVLISCRGAYSGKINFSPPKCFVTNNSLIIQTKDKVELDKRYLFYSLAAAKKNKLVTGTAQPQVTINNAIDLDIPLPPKPTQLAIVSKIEELFSEIEKGIESLFTAKEQLKKYRQSMLEWAFEGKLTNGLNGDLYDLPDEHDLSIAAESETEYRVERNHNNQKNQKNHSSDKGELPEGWEMRNLKDICKVIGGVTKGRDFKGKETIHLPYLRVANVQDGYLDLDEIKSIEVLPSDKEKYELIYGDILYTEGGDKDKLGRGTIWKEEIKNCIHQNHIFRARPSSKNINSKYVAYFSQTRSAKNYFFKHGKQTTNLASINLTILSNLPIPICSINEQNIIVEAIESRLSVADKMEESITERLQQAEALKQSILKKAFEGRLIC